MNGFVISTVFVVILGLIYCQACLSYGNDATLEKTTDQKNTSQNIEELSPLKQLENVTAENVVCQLGLVKVQPPQASNNNIGCVTEQDAPQIIERGWHYFVSPRAGSISLVMNTDQGIKPLKIGFYLNGSHIDDTKTWLFGNNSTDNRTYNILENTVYDFPNKEDIHHYNGTVKIFDYKGNSIPPDLKFNVTVLPNRNPYITGFDQNEAVIIKQESNGFDISGNLPGEKNCIHNPPHFYCITWTFGDEGSKYVPELPNENTKNPFHKYSSIGRLNGNVKVELDSANFPYRNFTKRDFGVLVLPDDVFNKQSLPQIEEWTDNNVYRQGYDNWPANQSLHIKIDPLPPIKRILTYMWNFGDNATTNSTSASSIDHVYGKNGTYLLNFTIKGKAGFHYNLLKTIYICPNPNNSDVC